MNNKKHRMIYLANDELVEKIKFMRETHQLNVSAVIRDALEKKYQELKNEDNKIN